MKMDYIENQNIVVAAENKGDTNQYIWQSTNYQYGGGKKAFFRNDYNSNEFTKLMDWKDQKRVNPDSGKICQVKSSSIVGKGMIWVWLTY